MEKSVALFNSIHKAHSEVFFFQSSYVVKRYIAFIEMERMVTPNCSRSSKQDGTPYIQVVLLEALIYSTATRIICVNDPYDKA